MRMWGTLEMRSRIGSWNRRNATLFHIPSSWPLAAELIEYAYSLFGIEKSMALMKRYAFERTHVRNQKETGRTVEL